MYKYFWVILLVLLWGGCAQPDEEVKRMLIQEYPLLYDAIFDRNDERILSFVDHPDSLVRSQAWKALIQTPVADTDLLLQKVMQYNTKDAWSSLWFQELTDRQIDYLNTLWQESSRYHEGLLTIFPEKANEVTFDLLLNTDVTESGLNEFDYAFAVGSVSRTLELSSEQQIQIFQKALSTKNSKLTEAYLYGFYRSRVELYPETITELIALWDNYYPVGVEGDQSIARILMPTNLDLVLRHFPIERYQTMDVQLAIEIAQGIAAHGPSDYSTVILNALLDHRNPNVLLATLQAIQRNEGVPDRLFSDIMNKVGLMDYQKPLVRLEALNSINEVSQYKDVVVEVAGEDPYLQTKKYEVLAKVNSESDFLDLIFEDIKHEERLNKFYAIQQLSRFWPNASEEFRNNQASRVKGRVLDLLMEVDRSMIFVMSPLFLDPLVIEDKDYTYIENMLTRFSLPEDVEVYQSITQVMYTRFESESKTLVDSLVKVGNVALNQTLMNQGWEIGEIEGSSPVFRSPDWDRLAKLTINPFLVIELERGEIIIEMDVLNAPVTIAGMDSLISDYSYYGVPFHRVVPNFVVQGGDVETQDGFGGPGYVVPTEASAIHYERGIVGIASAGTDTEGSQFFIMHQWKPHLNGRYTIVGKVVEGLDYVDRIIQGDTIQAMYWYK